jgi:hypothetical protein
MKETGSVVQGDNKVFNHPRKEYTQHTSNKLCGRASATQHTPKDMELTLFCESFFPPRRIV